MPMNRTLKILLKIYRSQNKQMHRRNGRCAKYDKCLAKENDTPCDKLYDGLLLFVHLFILSLSFACCIYMFSVFLKLF